MRDLPWLWVEAHKDSISCWHLPRSLLGTCMDSSLKVDPSSTAKGRVVAHRCSRDQSHRGLRLLPQEMDAQAGRQAGTRTGVRLPLSLHYPPSGTVPVPTCTWPGPDETRRNNPLYEQSNNLETKQPGSGTSSTTAQAGPCSLLHDLNRLYLGARLSLMERADLLDRREWERSRSRHLTPTKRTAPSTPRADCLFQSLQACRLGATPFHQSHDFSARVRGKGAEGWLHARARRRPSCFSNPARNDSQRRGRYRDAAYMQAVEARQGSSGGTKLSRFITRPVSQPR